jgi:hypothetical protein
MVVLRFCPLFLLLLATVACDRGGNRRAEEPRRDNSAARAIGRGAYKASQEAGKAAEKAGKELGKGIKEAREGWKEASREAKPKKRK